MDREKKLLIRAALGEPKVAVEAWKDWRSDFAGPNASSSLAWAGGYVYKNLLAAGVEDAFVKGIYRYNWLSNTSKKSKLLPTLRRISKITRVLPLKTFGFSHAKHSLGLRPIADFDIYVAPASLEAVASRLVELEFRPLMGTSIETIMTHIRLQRGSWNFIDSTGNDLDIHWKAFDHVSIERNEKVLDENSILVNTEFGPTKYVNSPLALACQIYVHALQGEDRYNGLFDVFNNTSAENVDSASKLIKNLDFCLEASQVIQELSDALEISQESPLGRLGLALKGSPTPKVSNFRVREQRLNQIPDSSLRFPKLYRFWFRAGANPLLERLHHSILGPMTNKSTALEIEGSLELKLDERPNLIPVGFHYQYPGQKFRWAHKGDARLRFDLIRSAGGFSKLREKNIEVRIELDTEQWSHAPVKEIIAYCNGQMVGSLNKSSTRLDFVFPLKTQEFEFSFRSRQRPSPLENGARYNWYQMQCPVNSISIRAR